MAFFKKIENETVSTTINSEQQLLTNNNSNNNNSWIFDLNQNCDDNEIDMDIDSDLVDVVNNNNNTGINDSTCDKMDIEEEADVTLVLKCAIGTERRQNTSTDNLISNENTTSDSHEHLSETTTIGETEQFFHDLCTELTNTTAKLVSSSSTNSLRCSTSSEQTVIH